jgi:hypothetical protein
VAKDNESLIEFGEFTPGQLFRRGPYHQSKFICVIDSEVGHRNFLIERLGQIEEFMPGDSKSQKLDIKCRSFMPPDDRPINYGEIMGEFIQDLRPEPDVLIISFMVSHDSGLIENLIPYLEDWFEKGAIFFMSDQNTEGNSLIPYFSRHSEKALRYIEDCLTRDETIM